MGGFYPKGRDKIEFWEAYWKMLHLITYLYPEEASEVDQHQALEFVLRLRTHLPYKCKECIKSYLCNLQQFPVQPRLIGRAEWSEWLIDIHNAINSEKRKRVYSYQEIHQAFSDPEAINRWFVDRYDLDISAFLFTPGNHFCELITRGHRAIIGKIIQNRCLVQQKCDT